MYLHESERAAAVETPVNTFMFFLPSKALVVLSVLFRCLGTVCFTPLAKSSCGTTAESNLECKEAWEIGEGKENVFFVTGPPERFSQSWSA